ncbi:S8 family serine peptidase [Bacillus swezeyi]|uniref:S8 family peptidase n=1 Tax=Bacillus swezeyi TaxID=1925020 RepID=UPI0039C68904
MKKYILGLFFVVIGLFYSHNNILADSIDNVSDWRTIILNQNEKYNEVYRLIKQNNVEQIEGVKEIGLISYKGPSLSTLHLTNKLSKTIEEEGHLNKTKVEASTKDQSQLGLNSPAFQKNNWYLRDITKDFESYKLAKIDPKVKVALIDSGVDVNHPYLKNNLDLQKAKSFVDNDSDISDDFGHGTLVAGVMEGIAPDISIVPYKVIGKVDGDSLWTIQAIIQAVKDGNKVINLSLGTYKSKNDKDDKVTIKAYERAINYAKKSNVVVVASSGNDGLDLDKLRKEKNNYHLPGGMNKVITVGGVLSNGELAPYSNYGKKVDFVAPVGYLGNNYDETSQIDIRDMIITSYPTYLQKPILDQIAEIQDGYTLTYGTSLAAPQVSAASALIISKYKNITGEYPKANKVKFFLKKGSIYLGKKEKYKIQKINVYNTLIRIK